MKISGKNHDELINTQGGSAGELYHITLDEHTKLVIEDKNQNLTNKTLFTPKINGDVVLTSTSTELNFVDGVNSNIQNQLDNKLNINENAVSATKLETQRNIIFEGDVTGSTTFDGTEDKNVVISVNDDSHYHVISNIDGLQNELDDKANSLHYHDDRYLGKTATAENSTLFAGHPVSYFAIAGQLDVKGGTI